MTENSGFFCKKDGKRQKMASISAFSQAQFIGCKPREFFLRPANKNGSFQTLNLKQLITRASCPRTTLPNVKSSTCFQMCTRAPVESENLLNLEMTPSLYTNNPSLKHPTTEIFNSQQTSSFRNPRAERVAGVSDRQKGF